MAQEKLIRYTIAVRNLPWTVCHNELEKYFSRFGYVKKAKVIFNKNTGFNKRFGYVIFGDKAALINAVQERRHMLEGCELKVNIETINAEKVNKE